MKKHLAPIGLHGICLISLFAITSLSFSISGKISSISHEIKGTYTSIVHLPLLNGAWLHRVRVKGKQEHLGIYECLCGESPEDMLNRIATQTDFEAGMRHFLAQQFEEAIQAFTAVLQSDPQDKVATKFLERTRHYLQNGVPEEWNGVELMEDK